MLIRTYTPADCAALARLFYDTVHTVNARDYTPEQLNAWAPAPPDPEPWNRSLLDHYSLVAVRDGLVAGFGDIDPTGYLDRLFVHKDFQRQGIASALCAALEQAVSSRVLTHASITARPFFEKRGYRVQKEQQVERRGVLLINYVMVLE